MEGTIYSDGNTLWINDEEKCITRINGINKLDTEMTTKRCSINGIDITVED